MSQEELQTMPDRDMDELREAELLPCPFCGGAEVYVEPDERGSGGQWVPPVHVGCKACGLDLVDLETDTREGSIAKWNRRAPVVSPSRGWREALEQIAAEDPEFTDHADGQPSHIQVALWRAMVIEQREIALSALSVAPSGEGRGSSRSCVEVQGDPQPLHAETPRFSDVNDLPPGVYENAAAVVLLCANPPFRSHDNGKTWKCGPLGVTRAYRTLAEAKLVRTDRPAGDYRRAWPTDDLMEAAQLILAEKRDWMEWPSSAAWFGAPSEGSHVAAQTGRAPSASTQLRDEKPTPTDRGGAE